MKTKPVLVRLFAAVAAFALALPAPAQAVRVKYVALGDSITAGFEGNCLVERHQRHDFASILASQLGITDFEQPLIKENPLSNSATPKCLGPVFAGGTISVGAVSDQDGPLNAGLARPYDNLGIPGATAADLVDLTTGNPAGGTAAAFAVLVLRNVPGSQFAGTSAVDQAVSLDPTIVTLWIGNNDVLGAALAGVAIDQVTLTPTAFFQAKYTQIVDALTADGRTIVILNIPDVTALPFATTIPRFVVNPVTRQPVLIGGAPVPLLGPRTTDTCSAAPCPLPEGTLVTLQASALLAQGIGVPAVLGGTGLPLPDGGFTPPATLTPGVLLYPDEVAAIRSRTDELNGVIAAVAGSHGAVTVDIHGIFEDIKANGYDIAGIRLTASFLTGGLFSADGFHPSNIAHAIIADEIIKALNAQAGAGIEEPDLFPALVTPDVPPGAGAASVAAVPYGFTASMGRSLRALFPPVTAGVAVVEPRTLLPPPRRGAPTGGVGRVLERPGADRSQ